MVRNQDIVSHYPNLDVLDYDQCISYNGIVDNRDVFRSLVDHKSLTNRTSSTKSIDTFYSYAFLIDTFTRDALVQKKSILIPKITQESYCTNFTSDFHVPQDRNFQYISMVSSITSAKWLEISYHHKISFARIDNDINGTILWENQSEDCKKGVENWYSRKKTSLFQVFYKRYSYYLEYPNVQVDIITSVQYSYNQETYSVSQTILYILNKQKKYRKYIKKINREYNTFIRRPETFSWFHYFKHHIQ
jgi:uncharacterized protein YuzB (UPF0349 family)